MHGDRNTAKEAHDRHRRLLRARRERPGGRAAEQRDELAAPHSITSSARASSIGGTVRPISLAVCKLTTNSNFVALKTGRSVGFSLLRTRAVYIPAKRAMSAKLGP